MNEKAKSFHTMLMRCRGKLLVCIIVLSACSSSLHAKADDKYIQEQVKSEIKRQLADRSAPQHQELREKIEKNIHHELKSSGYIKKREKKERTKKRKHSSDDRYLLPEFPYYSLFYSKGDFVQLLADVGLATQAYGSTGRTKDLSALVFGTDAITVQDILLVSKLARASKLQAGAPLNSVDLTKVNHFLSILADQAVRFDAWENRFGVGLNFARHYCHDDVSFGIHIPVVGKTHRLRLKNDIDDAHRVQLDNVKAGHQATDATVDIAGLAAATQYQFDQQYPGGLKDLVTSIIEAKEMSFNDRTTTQVGLGDIDAYLNFVIHSRHIDRFVVGAHVIFPSAREADTDKIWGHELGNGGFVQLGGFFSMLWEKCCWFNPYIHAKGTYGFAARVTRRVPRRLQNDVTALGLPLRTCDFVLGQNLLYANPVAAFDELDSSVKRFADNVRKIKIRPGAELLLRLGNAFTGILGKGGAFDIHYDLKVKGRDYLGARRSEDEFDGSILNVGSWSVAHIFGAQYSYQFQNMARVGGGLSYAVAGRNYPKELTFHFDLNFEF